MRRKQLLAGLAVIAVAASPARAALRPPMAIRVRPPIFEAAAPMRRRNQFFKCALELEFEFDSERVVCVPPTAPHRIATRSMSRYRLTGQGRQRCQDISIRSCSSGRMTWLRKSGCQRGDRERGVYSRRVGLLHPQDESCNSLEAGADVIAPSVYTPTSNDASALDGQIPDGLAKAGFDAISISFMKPFDSLIPVVVARTASPTDYQSEGWQRVQDEVLGQIATTRRTTSKSTIRAVTLWRSPLSRTTSARG